MYLERQNRFFLKKSNSLLLVKNTTFLLISSYACFFLRTMILFCRNLSFFVEICSDGRLDTLGWWSDAHAREGGGWALKADRLLMPNHLLTDLHSEPFWASKAGGPQI